jgi:hypothetical protein
VRKAALIVGFLCLASTAYAEHADRRLSNGVVVEERAVAPRLPDGVLKMSARDYYDWAVRQNDMALAEAARYEGQEGPSRFAYVTERSGMSQTRFGGGVGYGGYGGNGGYAGYPSSTGGGYGGFGGMGYGMGNGGNAMQSSYGSSSKSYELEFKAWPTWHGGMATLFNPWVKPAR